MKNEGKKKLVFVLAYMLFWPLFFYAIEVLYNAS
jgi:hypothetical protein